MFVIAMLVSGAVVMGTEAGAQQLTPHFPGWERYFTVTAETFERRGRPHLSGYVVSHYGAPASRMQLLVEGLDSSGAVIGQRVEWLAGELPPFSRQYFEVPVPGPASTYRVRVFAFDLIQAAVTEAP
jgi:hypothetical protein